MMSVIGDPVSKRGRGVTAAAILVLLASNLCLGVIAFVSASAVVDIATPLTGHMIGFGVSAALALVFSRYAWRVLIIGIGFTLGLHTWLALGPSLRAAPVVSAPAPVDPAGGRPLSVITLNTWDGIDNVEQLKAYFLTAPADIVVMSEIGPPKRHLLAALKSVYPYQTDCADVWQCSLALISRVPFEQGGTVRYTKDMPAFVWARFPGAFTIVGVHIFRPSRNPWLHVRETNAVARFVRNIGGSVVLVGDFNMSPWSYSYRFLKSEAGLEAPRGLTPTWPAWPIAVPQFALDHILISGDLAFEASHAGPAIGSDHLPVFAKIKRVPNTARRKPPSRSGGSRLAATGAHLDGQLLADLGSKHRSP